MLQLLAIPDRLADFSLLYPPARQPRRSASPLFCRSSHTRDNQTSPTTRLVRHSLKFLAHGQDKALTALNRVLKHLTQVNLKALA